MATTKLASPSSLLLVWFLVAVLLSQSMAMSTSFEDQKNYYPPAPHAGSGSPPSGSSSHGGHGHHHGAPPENCGSPPVDPGTPSTPSPHVPTPSTPSPHVPTPSTPSPHVPTPSTPSPHVPTPSTPSHVPTPSAPSGGGSPPTPIIVGTPSAPGIPGITPTPPFLPTTPGTCYYWLTHPHLIWGVVGWWGTIGNIFNFHHSVPGVLPSLTLQQALSNTRTDGLGALFREGTASMLNSMVSNKFPFTTQQVRDSFVSALSSDSAAATQARLFKLANEGRLKPRA